MVRLVVTIAALALLVSACTDDAKIDAPTPTTTAQGHVEPENFNDVVLAGASRSASAGFSGAYTIRATVDGKAIDGVVTWHRKDARLRAGFAGQVDGQRVDIDAITGPNYPAEDLLYVCAAEDETCAEAHRTENGAYPPELLPSVVALQLLDIQAFAQGLNFYDEAARTIIEQPALCFIGRSETGGAIDHGEVCLTDDGLPLLVTASGAGRTVSLTAQELPGGVGDRDFELPFPIEGQ